MMRILAIAGLLALGAYVMNTGGLPQANSVTPSNGSFSGYTGAVGHAISPLTGD